MRADTVSKQQQHTIRNENFKYSTAYNNNKNNNNNIMECLIRLDPSSITHFLHVYVVKIQCIQH